MATRSAAPKCSASGRSRRSYSPRVSAKIVRTPLMPTAASPPALRMGGRCPGSAAVRCWMDLCDETFGSACCELADPGAGDPRCRRRIRWGLRFARGTSRLPLPPLVERVGATSHALSGSPRPAGGPKRIANSWQSSIKGRATPCRWDWQSGPSAARLYSSTGSWSSRLCRWIKRPM